MARIVKAEIAQDLTDLFPPLEPISLSPTSISDELLQTFDLLPGTHRFRSVQQIDVTGLVGAVSVNSPTVPDGFYDYVIAWQMSHNDPVARRARIDLFGPPATAVAVLNSQDATLANVFPLSGNRPILLPPFFGLRAVVEAIAVGSTVRLLYMFVRNRILEGHPKI